MPCDITLYWDKDYRGRSQNFTSSKGDLNANPVTVGRGDATSYRVNADENCLITGWKGRDLSGDGRFLRGDEPNLDWRRKWNDNNWNDAIESIGVERIPSASSSEMEYHIPIGHYTPRDFNDKYCDGCRWWPEVKDRDFKNANRDDVMVREGVTFRPCPGGTGYFNSASGVKCIYSKTDGTGLRTLYSNKNGIQNDPRATMHATLKDTFCKDPGNYTKDPGGGTCLERDSGKTIAKAYCKVGNRIKSDGACTRENLGNYYTELAVAFCKTSAGRSDPWCSCYNVMNGVCDKNSAAAGCDKKRRTFDKLVEATPEDFKTSWSQMEPCFGGVCQGSVFQPAGYNSNCSRSVQVCVQNFDIQGIADSPINATCNLNSDSGSSAGGGDGGDNDKDTMYEPGSIPDKLDKNFRSKLPKSIQAFIPVSVEDVQKDSKKIVGLGGPLLSIFCFLLIIILLISMTGGKKRRYLR